MQTSEHDIEFGRGPLKVRIMSPDPSRRARRMVLIVTDPAYDADEHRADTFRELLAQVLTDAECQVAYYDSHTSNAILDDYEKLTLSDQVDELSAVFRWLHVNNEKSAATIDVIAVGLGMTVVAGLLSRTNDLGRMVLIAPVTAETVRSHWTVNGVQEPRISLLPSQVVATLDEVDCMSTVASADTPLLLVHGAADTVAPVSTSIELATARRNADRQVSLRLVPFGNHYFTESDGCRACAHAILEFLST